MFIDSNNAVLKRYLEDIRKTTPLSKEEESALFKDKKNPVVRRKIVDSNMRFVLKTAIKFNSCPIPLPDLINVGAMGLMHAIDYFDDSRGVRFVTYGVHWIRAFITKAINDQGKLVRMPANLLSDIRKGLKDLAKGQEVEEKILYLIQLGQKGVSLDGPLKTDSKASFAESLSDNSVIDPEAISEIKIIEDGIRNILKNLPEREYNVLSGIYGIGFGVPKTLREVGEDMNISHERVRQLRDQALKRITHLVSKEVLREDMETLARIKQNYK